MDAHIYLVEYLWSIVVICYEHTYSFIHDILWHITYEMQFQRLFPII